MSESPPCPKARYLGTTTLAAPHLGPSHNWNPSHISVARRTTPSPDRTPAPGGLVDLTDAPTDNMLSKDTHTTTTSNMGGQAEDDPDRTQVTHGSPPAPPPPTTTTGSNTRPASANSDRENNRNADNTGTTTLPNAPQLYKHNKDVQRQPNAAADEEEVLLTSQSLLALASLPEIFCGGLDN